MTRKMSARPAEVNSLPALIGLALAGAIAAVWIDIAATCAGWR
jgi:hypothetical protein